MGKTVTASSCYFHVSIQLSPFGQTILDEAIFSHRGNVICDRSPSLNTNKTVTIISDCHGFT
ncbi:MAG: hypothetical protein IKW74_06395 [Thermoguttaceae bacterium]|nr:hypothetical protein [Thermoguttaceae bacterium]